MPPGNRATATAPICGERKNMKVKRIIMMVLAGMLFASGLGYSQNNKVSKTADSELIDAVAALDNKQYKEAKAGENHGDGSRKRRGVLLSWNVPALPQ